MPPPPLLLEDDLACHAIVATSLLNNSAVAWIYAGEFGIAYQLLSHAVNNADDGSVYSNNPNAFAAADNEKNAKTSSVYAATNTISSGRPSVISNVSHQGDHHHPNNNNNNNPAIVTAAPQRDDKNCHCCCHTCMPPPFFGRLPFVSCPLSRPYTCRSDGGDQCQSFVLFDRPLIVETTLAIQRQAPELVQAAIHYNLALLYQLESGNTGKSCYAKQADRLYAAAHQAMDRALERGAIAEGDAALMLLAIWNNRAYIRSWTIIDYIGADVLLQQMKTLLRQCAPAGGSFMPLCDHRIFFLNALIHDNNRAIVGSASAA